MPSSSPGSLENRQKQVGTGFFFAVALGFTGILQLPALLLHFGLFGGHPERLLPLVGLGAFGPVLAAVVASRRERQRGGSGKLSDPLRVRFGILWGPAALLLFPTLHALGAAVHHLVSSSGGVAFWYPPENQDQIAALFLFPLIEEPGWRGFAMPRLADRYGPLQASLVVGLFWATWHVIMFILQGMTATMFVVALVNILAGSVVFGWLWARTSGSLVVAILAHAGAHLSNPTHAMPASTAPFHAYTAAVVTAAALLGTAMRAHRPRATMTA